MSHEPVVIGIDPERHGADAVRLGHLLATITAASPLIVTVAVWPRLAAWGSHLQRSLESDAGAGFELARERLAGLDPETVAIRGDSAAGALERIAEQAGAKLIVVGSSHRSAAGRTLAGSVGLSLMQAAPCAIAIAPAGFGDDPEPAQARRIAVAYDGAPESAIALRTGIALAARAHARLAVLAVSEPPRYGFATDWEVLMGEGLVDRDRERKQALVDKALAAMPAEIDASGAVLGGDAGSELGRAGSGYDLMLAGSRSHGPMRRALLGSTTRSLIASARCPVMILPRGAGDDPLGLTTAATLSEPLGAPGRAVSG